MTTIHMEFPRPVYVPEFKVWMVPVADTLFSHEWSDPVQVKMDSEGNMIMRRPVP